MSERVALFVIYCLLCVIIILEGVLVGQVRQLIVAQKDDPLRTTAATIYIHGQALDDDALPIAGFRADLFYGGRQIGSSTSNASGYWGISVTAQTGPYELRFTTPDSHPIITQVLKAPNITDFTLAKDRRSCTFRISPAGGQTGNFLVFCAPMVTMATPTLTATLEPVTPSATWTPGPTPTAPATGTSVPTLSPTPTGTPCIVDPPAALVEGVWKQFSAVFPPPDNELTEFGFELALGWPMLEKTMEVNGQQFIGQVWTPFTVIVRWPNGCISIIDAWTLWHREGAMTDGESRLCR